MVSRIDSAAQNLLLQRRVLEEIAATGKRFPPGGMWSILRKVHKEYRSGPVKLCSELVVQKPSAELSRRMNWLCGLVDVRNCLTHRLGVVQLIDVKPAGAAIEDTKDTDRLRAIWLRPKVLLGDREITLPYLHEGPDGAQLSIGFDEYQREWAIGDKIEITPDDCQAISFSLSFLGNHLLADFEREVTDLLRASSKLSLSVQDEIRL
jgi:hypothetical protein